MNDLYRLDTRFSLHCVVCFSHSLAVVAVALSSKSGVNCVWRTLIGMDEEKQEWLGEKEERFACASACGSHVLLANSDDDEKGEGDENEGDDEEDEGDDDEEEDEEAEEEEAPVEKKKKTAAGKVAKAKDADKADKKTSKDSASASGKASKSKAAGAGVKSATKAVAALTLADDVPTKGETMADFFARTKDHWSAAVSKQHAGAAAPNAKELRKAAFDSAQKQFDLWKDGKLATVPGDKKKAAAAKPAEEEDDEAEEEADEAEAEGDADEADDD